MEENKAVLLSILGVCLAGVLMIALAVYNGQYHTAHLEQERGALETCIKGVDTELGKYLCFKTSKFSRP